MEKKIIVTVEFNKNGFCLEIKPETTHRTVVLKPAVIYIADNTTTGIVLKYDGKRTSYRGEDLNEAIRDGVTLVSGVNSDNRERILCAVRHEELVQKMMEVKEVVEVKFDV